MCLHVSMPQCVLVLGSHIPFPAPLTRNSPKPLNSFKTLLSRLWHRVIATCGIHHRSNSPWTCGIGFEDTNLKLLTKKCLSVFKPSCMLANVKPVDNTLKILSLFHHCHWPILNLLFNSTFLQGVAYLNTHHFHWLN